MNKVNKLKSEQLSHLKQNIIKDEKFVSVISASFGDGHNAAAKGVVEAFNSLKVPNSGLIDLLEQIHPATMSCFTKGYRLVTTRWPAIWEKMYMLAESFPFGNESFDLMPSITNGFSKYLKETKPDAIISTYPLYGHIIERIFGNGDLPFKFVTMITDSKSINKSWFHGASGEFAVLDQISANKLISHGISSERIHITGFPVSPRFLENRPKEFENKLPKEFKILYTPTSNNLHVASTLRELNHLTDKSPNKISLTIVMGRHSNRLDKIVRSQAPEGSTIIGWTKRMSELLSASHLIIGKAGGASVQEAMASACPMIIDSMIPGQEEGNAEMITKIGAGIVAFEPKEIRSTIEDLLGNNGKEWLKFRKNCHIKSTPEAALSLAKIAIN